MHVGKTFPMQLKNVFLHARSTTVGIATSRIVQNTIVISLHYLNLTVQLKSREDDSTTLLDGRADFFVTLPSVAKHNLLKKVLCVIEVQSKNDEDAWEYQLLVYFLLLMNKSALPWLVGFLILKDGRCRAFKATRDINGNCVYESNGLFSVAYIVDVFHNIVQDITTV